VAVVGEVCFMGVEILPPIIYSALTIIFFLY